MNEQKYLIVGLGNPGVRYECTRHNAGFMMVDALADELNPGASFQIERYGELMSIRLKNKQLCLLKPSTMMNLSGNAVRYWLQKEQIPLSNLLVIVDELALPFGSLRLKGKGSDGGHNGLKHIQELLNTTQYARLRVGIGNDFPRGGQVDYVLAPFSEEECQQMPEVLKEGVKIIRSFCLLGLDRAMNQHNKKTLS